MEIRRLKDEDYFFAYSSSPRTLIDELEGMLLAGHRRQIEKKQALQRLQEEKSKRSIEEALKHWTKSMKLQALRRWARVYEEHDL